MATDSAKNKGCDYNTYKRVRYFDGMLLTARDFQEEQIYHQEKRRLLNRMLHGWGVVCGLGVKPTKPASSRVIITPGTALDCLGNEIVVCSDFEVDLKKLPDLCPDKSKGEKDPCAERETGDCKYYIGIKYNEAPTDPVPVYVAGGSCEEKTCEYSRVREGFCIRLFKSPPCHAVFPKDGLFEKIVNCTKAGNEKESEKEMVGCMQKVLDDFRTSFCGHPYPCPTCCCDGEPYVILGSIDLTDTNCTVKTIADGMIDINDGRRYVMTPMFWQYFFGSLFPKVGALLDNPFTLICEDLNQLAKQPDKRKKDMARRAMAVETVEKVAPGTTLELAIKANRALFQPSAGVEEKVDVSGLRREMDAKLAEIRKKNTEDLKKMDAAYQKKLDEMSRTIKELRTKIGK
jgi:hypothetical protein